MWWFKFFLSVDLRTKNLPIKPCGVSTSFVSRLSHQESSRKTMWHFTFFFWVNLRTKNLPRKPCRVSSLFVSQPSHQRTFPENHVAFQVFFVSRLSHQRTFPENHVAFQLFLWVDLRTKEPSQKTMWRFKVFFLSRPSHQEPSQKTMWRFKPFFVSRPSHQRTFPENHVAFQVFFVSRPSHQRTFPKKTWKPSQKTMWRFKVFLWVDLRTKEPSKKPCGGSSFFCESTFAPRTFPKNHVEAGPVKARHGSQRTQFKAPPMHWLTKGWPGRWHHSTTLCSPMQEIHFELSSLASMTCLFISCPPYTIARSSLPPRGTCAGRRPQALACFKCLDYSSSQCKWGLCGLFGGNIHLSNNC